MSDKNQVQTGGVSFLVLLTIVFIVLKLTGYIAWSWLWVLSPLWLPITIVFLAPALFLFIVFVFAWVTGK